MKFNIQYISYEGNQRNVTAEGEDEADAVRNAMDSEGNYSGDNIWKVITVEQCPENETEL